MKKSLFYAGLVFLADQLSKLYITWVLMDEKNVLKVTSFLNIVNVRNKGVSFSFLSNDSQIMQYFIMLMVSAIVLWLLLWLRKEKDCWVRLSLAFIIGGAFGNLLDRFAYGAVVDFIDFHIFGLHWPAFNIADTFICVGAFILMWRTILTPVKRIDGE